MFMHLVQKEVYQFLQTDKPLPTFYELKKI